MDRQTHTHTDRNQSDCLSNAFGRLSNKHYCVLSNSGLSNATSKRQNWHSSVGKYVHHNRKTAKIRFCTPLKSVIYFRFVSKQQASSRPHFRAVYKVLWKTVNNCVRNRYILDKIDTETEICTSLKFEFYFRFR